MDYPDLIGFVPSALSAVASIAAAVAAFGSLRVSRESKRVAEQGALAVHHGPASKALSDALGVVALKSEVFSRLAFDVWSQWAREIEKYDCRAAGGSDPRPLRHVLANGSEMLERHATEHGKNYRHAHRPIYSIIRSGMGETSDAEYRRLLKKADGTYHDFEAVFGSPRVDREISSSQAFRWAYYQLTHRVTNDDWREIWAKAWREGGWLKRYCDEFAQLEPVLRRAQKTLKAEKAKLQHSVFPLDTNDSLNLKYSRALGTLEGLIEVGELDLWEGFIDEPHNDDLVPLVLYSMGVARFAFSAIESLAYEF
jgi:hypothetical protein